MTKKPHAINDSDTTFPISVSIAQRRIIARLLPCFDERLLLDDPKTRTVRFTLSEIHEIGEAAKAASPGDFFGMERQSRVLVADAFARALDRYQEGSIDRIHVSERLYQFKISLKDIEPTIWRRIQVKECNLERFHIHLQLAMGWQNCHLHQFKINGEIYGDSHILDDGYEDSPQVIEARDTKLSDIVPKDGRRFEFTYQYDFGDSWEHEILFEGCLHAEKGTRYPLCVEGAHACPPEDVGGQHCYPEYLEAIADPKHEEHERYLQWRGPFDPEEFDAERMTKRMQRGKGNWPTNPDEYCQ